MTAVASEVADLTGQNVLIDLPDGATIAATLVLPKGSGPFPVLLSFYPYRKDDFIGASTAYARQYFAEAGYATLLVDIRGYGSSSGRSYQTWDPREFDDATIVVEWAAKQAWCNGRTGVWGASYGGHKSLGVATRRPPSLRAIAAVYGAGDIYEDFVYPGGCPNGLGASAWGALVVANELAPPTLQDAEGRWLDVWRERLARLEDGEISSMLWPAHPTCDEYWQRRVVPIEDIAVPAFFLSGWRDLLCKGMLDAYERCRSTKHLVAGPWTHAAPDLSVECPFDWLLEIRRWFDRWMKDEAALDKQVAVSYFVQGANEWRHSDQWPPAGTTRLTRWAGADGKLTTHEQASLRQTYVGTALVGVEAGLWYPMGLPLTGTFDQSRDDAKSLAYTSDAVSSDIDILGAPRAQLVIGVAQGKEVHLCVKLCHIGPDDRSILITSGWARLPRAAAGASQPVTVDIPLYPTAYRIPAGHRLRWTIACADFPRLWPTAETPTITVISTADTPSCISVPIYDPAAGKKNVFQPSAPPAGVNRAPWVERAVPMCRITRDEGQQGVGVSAGVSVTLRLPQGGKFSMDHSVSAEMQDAHPAAATMRTRAKLVIELASAETIVVETSGYATLGRRHISGRIIAADECIYERRWSTFNGKSTETASHRKDQCSAVKG